MSSASFCASRIWLSTSRCKRATAVAAAGRRPLLPGRSVLALSTRLGCAPWHLSAPCCTFCTLRTSARPLHSFELLHRPLQAARADREAPACATADPTTAPPRRRARRRPTELIGDLVERARDLVGGRPAGLLVRPGWPWRIACADSRMRPARFCDRARGRPRSWPAARRAVAAIRPAASTDSPRRWVRSASRSCSAASRRRASSPAVPARSARRFVAQPALGIGELARLELQIAHRAAPLVRPRALHLLLEAAQLLRRLSLRARWPAADPARRRSPAALRISSEISRSFWLSACPTSLLADPGLLACWPAGLLACWPAASSSTAPPPAAAVLPVRASVVRAAASLPRRSSDPCSCARSRCCFDRPSCRRASSRIAGERILLFFLVSRSSASAVVLCCS